TVVHVQDGDAAAGPELIGEVEGGGGGGGGATVALDEQGWPLLGRAGEVGIGGGGGGGVGGGGGFGRGIHRGGGGGIGRVPGSIERRRPVRRPVARSISTIAVASWGEAASMTARLGAARTSAM